MNKGWIEKSSTLRVVICAAIGMAVLFSIFAFFSTLQVNSLGFESFETICLLKNQVKERKEELEATKQEKKAGPFGSVKSEISPTVSPDESKNPKLAKILTKVAINKELIVVLANSNVHPLLELQISSIKRVGISNYLVYALDNATVHLCKLNEITYYEGVDDPAGKSPVGSVVSALKFQVLREFLEMGYNVLLTDTDVLFLQNPFNHLYRDSDVESMSDGHDAWSAYGYNDVFDDPEMEVSRSIYTNRIWVFNSGFFYIRATVPGIELLDRVTESLRRRPGAWDQAVYNEELFFPSCPDYVGLTAAKRAMDIYLFVNSKVLFKTIRKDPELRKKMPVIVHINYHPNPDKLPRMKAAVEFYVNGKEDALDPFSVGTPRT